ncbi:MAG: DUF2490 domain-containing protein [Sphingobacteriaceae bacterium]|nr:MAG: DUF2490 domain-containing protein [Sphingobacteriaceae bacterium]
MMKYKAGKAVLFFFLFSVAFIAKAQNNKTGVFSINSITLPGDSAHRWGGYIELQARSNEFFNQFFYYETKGGISYDVAKNYTALLGAGRYYTDDEAAFNQAQITEFRMWEQMTVSQFLDRLKIEHRYRAEQRWQNGIYRNRFRYRLSMAIPLNHPKIEAKTFFISIFDEIFLSDRAPHFERNRFSAGLGYQFDKAMSLQVGWLNQYNFNLTSAGAKNNLALIFNYRIHRKNSKPKEHIPGVHD